MALTQISTAGVKDDAVTSGKIPANAVGSSEIADTAVTLAKLAHGTSSNDGKFLRANNGADPTFETVSSVGGATGVGFNDSVKVQLGTDNDLRIFYNGSDSFIQHHDATTNNDLRIESDTKTIFGSVGGAETHAVFNDDGAIELYHNNSKKIETTTSGIDVTGAITVNGSALASGLFSSYAVVTDQKANGTDGGTFDNGAWRVRDINTEKFDPDSIVSISGNEITLVAGTYYIEVSAPSYGTTRHMAKIYSISSPSEDWFGENAFAHGSHYATTHSFVRARIVCSSARTIGIAHRCETSRGTTGFGIACGFGNVETYTIVKIFKEA